MTQSLPGDSPAANDTWAATWAAQNAKSQEIADGAIDGHVASEWHHGRFQFVVVGCDLGVPGTVLDSTLLGIWGHRVMRFPMEVATWDITASPAGSATVDILKAADQTAFNAGTYTSIATGSVPTLTSQRANSGAALGVWADAVLNVGEVVIFELTSVSGAVEVLSVQLNPRRT